MNSSWSHSHRTVTALVLRRYAIHPLMNRRWNQVRSNSTPEVQLNGWKAVSLNDYKAIIKNSKGSVLFDAKDPSQKRRPLVEPTRPTDLPYDNEIQASHVKLISQEGKIMHTSALLKSVLADIKAKNANLERPADRLILVQVAGLAYLPPQQAKPEPVAESSATRSHFRARPPWRQNPPTCRLFTREELRRMAKEEEKQVREVEKRKRSGKEIETSWTVSPQDMFYVCRRLEEFLNDGRSVTVIIKRTKKWKVPSEEEVERTLSELRAAAEKVQGAFEENCDGNPGFSMILDFKVRTDLSSESGRWQGLVPDKTIRLAWKIREKQLDTHLKDIRQSLRKGKHVAVKFAVDQGDTTKIKDSMAAKHIISQIRLAVGNVKDAVEILPRLPANGPNEDTACENYAPWEFRFEANSKKKNIPRNITMDSDDSTKQLNLKMDWAKSYLDANLQTRILVHQGQVAAVKQIFEERVVEAEEMEKKGEYNVFEIRSLKAPVEEDRPSMSLPFTLSREAQYQQPSQKQGRQNNAKNVDNLLELLSKANRQEQGSRR